MSSVVEKLTFSLGPRNSTDTDDSISDAGMHRELLRHGGGDDDGGNTTSTSMSSGSSSTMSGDFLSSMGGDFPSTISGGFPSGISGGFPRPSTTGAIQTLSTSTDKGAIAGGAVGGVVGLLIISGLLWWCLRRRRQRKRLADREKIEIDPSDSTPALRAPPNPAANLVVAPGTRELRDEGVSGAGAPTQSPPRYWQVHNSSLSSLQQQETYGRTLPEKLALSTNLPPSSPNPSAAAALSTIGTLGHSGSGEGSASDASEGEAQAASAPESPISTETHPHTNPFSDSEYISDSPTSPPSTSSHDHRLSSLTHSTSLGSASVALSAESEVLHLRRQVELLSQENARLAEGHAQMLAREAPPAYEGRDDDDDDEEEEGRPVHV